jgi:hypothetical protein
VVSVDYTRARQARHVRLAPLLVPHEGDRGMKHKTGCRQYLCRASHSWVCVDHLRVASFTFG